MATRSRTLVFLSYRNLSNRATRKDRPINSELQGLIPKDVEQGGDVVVEMSVLPPKW